MGRETAYAPGYGTADQVEWLAGAIVHDACHSESLALHEDGSIFFAYVSGLIEGIDDPANAYWNDPNRHWWLAGRL